MLRRILNSPWLYFGLAAVLAVAAVLSQIKVTVPSRPVRPIDALAELRERDDINVLFILIDTLRADRLSSYGYKRKTSASIDSLAADGIRFAHVESQSTWTKCSMASLWTSLYPTRSGVTRFDDVIVPEVEMPAERLQAAGFRTAGIWRNGWVANNFGFDQGFNIYYQPKANKTPERMQRRRPGSHPLQGTDLDVTQPAVEFLRTYRNERFFLYLHYMDVHQYLHDEVASQLHWGNTLSDHYDASIHWTDRNVGTVLKALEEEGLFDHTIVVLAVDHGEGFREHGAEGHARTLFAEVTQVPLVIALPFRLKGGLTVEPLVRNVDIWPTLYDLLGMDPPRYSDGRSLVPLIEAAARGEDPPAAPEASDPVAYAYLDQTWGQNGQDPAPIASIRTPTEKFLVSKKRPDDPMLFDHVADPREQHNLAESEPGRVEEFEAKMETFLAQKPAWAPSKSVEIDEMRMGQLRALGYFIDNPGKKKDDAQGGEQAPDAD